MDPILLALITLIIGVGVAYLVLQHTSKNWGIGSSSSGNLTTTNNNTGAEGDGNASATTKRRTGGGGVASDSEDDSDEDDSDAETLVDGGADAGAARLVAGGGGREAQRRARRAAEQEERRMQRQGFLEGQRQKKEEELEKEEKARRTEEAARQLEEKTLQQLRAEAKRKKEEEYNTWVDAIAVEERGEQGAEDENEEVLMANLLEIILTEKVVVLHDLSIKLGQVMEHSPRVCSPANATIPVERIVSGIENLIAADKLSGVFDDRGKFVCISTREYNAVSNFISHRGRVSMTELIRECNRVVEDDGGGN